MSKIKKLRQELNINQSELAETLGVSQGTIARWENGSFNPRLNVLRRLCEYLLDIVLRRDNQ